MAPDDIRTEAVEARPSLDGLPTRDLLLTLQAANSVKAELVIRGGVFLRDVLSKVEGFPSDLKLRECAVHISEPAQGQGQLALCVRIPVQNVGAKLNVTDAYHLKLKLKEAFENLSGVACVEINGSLVGGIGSLVVVLDPDHVSGPGEPVQADDSVAEERPVLSDDPSEAVRRRLAAEVAETATVAARAGRGGGV